MTDENGGTLRAVAWSELCPWLNLLRSFRIAIGFRVLLLSAVAAVLTVTGWTLILAIFSGDPQIAGQMGTETSCPWLALADLVPEKPGEAVVAANGRAGMSGRLSLPVPPSWKWCAGTVEPWLGTWEQLSRPFRWMFFPSRGAAQADNSSDSEAEAGSGVSWFVCLLLCGLWGLAVWSFFGGAVTRSAAVQLACEERIGWNEMIRYGWSKWRSYFAAPLLPLCGVAACTVPVAGIGLLLRWNIGVLVAAVAWPVLLVAGLFIAWLLLGLLFGWPLMFATISAEGTDCFDAVSRSYEYILRHPLRYLFYVVVAAVLGLLGWLLVSNFAAAAVWLTYWAAGWGGSAQRVGLVVNLSDDLKWLGWFGAWLIRFWCECLQILAVGFLYSYFWTSSTAIYFLLRRDEDNQEMDEVYLEDDDDQQAYGLPPLETDEAGAPQTTDDAHRVDDSQ